MKNLLYDNDVTESVWKDMSNDGYMHNYSNIKAYNEDDIVLIKLYITMWYLYMLSAIHCS